jgi:protein-S-isoprenylcysteine O-methyltransferase Ste14
MNRAIIGVVLVVALVALGVTASERPDLFPENLDVPRLVYLTMALLLVAGAGYGFTRMRFDGARAIVSLVIWAGVIVAIAAAYAIFR